MELIERLPILKIHYLNLMSFKDFKKFCSSSASNEDERKKQYDILKGFCKGNIKARGEMKRLYSYTQKTPLDVGGRLYCGNSLQGLGKQFRGFLCEDVTTDIDMKNAHPTFAAYLCKLHDIPCPQLSYYISNRDEILAQFGPDGKELFLKALNDDKLNKKEKNKIFKDFDKECKDIQKKLSEIEDYKHIVDSVPETKLYNWLGSACNRIFCVYENKILQTLISFLNQRQIDICSLAFDGLMMYHDYYGDEELLQEITKFIESKWDGLNMKWAFKQHSTDIEMPDEWEVPVVETPDGVWNDNDAAEVVYKEYPHWVYCRGELFVYDKTTGKWSSDEIIHWSVIMSLTDKLFVLNEDKDGNITRSKLSYGNTENLIKKLPKLIKTMCRDDNWYDNNQLSSLGKILFPNGYYDFKTGLFHEKDKDGFNNPEIMFLDRIYNDFEPFTDEDMVYMETIKKRFFHDPLGENMGNYMILNLARALAGDLVKRICFGLGPTNCGKSVLVKAVTLSCGGYAGTFNAENLAYRQSSADEAALMRWVLGLCSKRFIFSNEIKSTTDLNGNLMKKISSGGDSIIGRMMCMNETEVVPQFMAFVMANDLPKIKPYDDAVNGRCKVFSYQKQFVADPTNEFELKMDPNIEKEMVTKRFQQCFVGLLLKEYLAFKDCDFIETEPIQMITSKDEWIQEEKSYVTMLTNEFELTNNPKDWVLSTDIQKWIDDNKLGITMTKMGVELNKHCKLNELKDIKSDVKKIGGKTKRVWFGIKTINEIDDDTSS